MSREKGPAEPPPLKEVAEAWGIAVDYAAIESVYYGYYAPDKKFKGGNVCNPSLLLSLVPA